MALPLAAQGDRTLLPVDEFVKDWEISKQFTLDVADKMPAEKYSFRASEPEMTFGGQMYHIAASLEFRFHQLAGTPGEMPAWVTSPPKTATKDEILGHLREAFDFVIATVPKLTGEQLRKMYKVDWKGRPDVNGRQMMLNMFVHVAHHRAQAEVYLRINGIAPPVYTF
jgi:uncharacterized damage-inducible protein DinB